MNQEIGHSFSKRKRVASIIHNSTFLIPCLTLLWYNKSTVIKQKSMADETENYKKMLSDLIKKQMVMLGPNIALDKARKVPGLKLDDSGEVLEMDGDPRMVLKGVANEYMTLSGQIAQMTLNTLLEKYPGVQNI